MKSSVYNMFFPYEEKFILYNAASGNVILTNKAEISGGDVPTEKLAALGFLVEENLDEFQNLVERAEAHICSSRKNKFRILTTTACNAKCPYCYEKGAAIYSMDKATAEKTAAFVFDLSKNKRELEIEWFGGEPLLNTAAVDYFTGKLNSLKPDGLKFEASMISNGYLINDEIIKKMRGAWNVKRVQITLDGLDAEYERVKSLGKNSFGRVIENIGKLCAADIQVDIRLNFGAENVSHIEAVIEFLAKCNFKDKIYVYVAKINTDEKTDKFLLERETIYLCNALYRYGFLTPQHILPKTLKSPCAACRVDYFTIHPSGRLYKCDRKMLLEKSIGDVANYDLGELTAKTKSWLGVKVEARCKKCALLPLCWNGCIYDRLNNLDRCYLTRGIVGNRLKLFVREVLQRNFARGR